MPEYRRGARASLLAWLIAASAATCVPPAAAQDAKIVKTDTQIDALMRDLVHAKVKHNVLIKDATHFVLFEKHRQEFFGAVLGFLKE